jgi:hypothetical protein
MKGVEHAADRPERPVQAHSEYGRPDDLLPRPDNEAEEPEVTAQRGTRGEEIDREDLPGEESKQIA